jgi:fructosamine-3-kinase
MLRGFLEQKLREHFGWRGVLRYKTIRGGSINDCQRVGDGNLFVFVKSNSATKFPQLFEKEKHGLELIQKQAVIKTPGIIDCFEIEGQQLLLLEWIESGERTTRFWESFGKQLAALHQVRNETFGLSENNYMGSLPQINNPSASWTDFFRSQRLQPLVNTCLSKQLLSTKHVSEFEKLYSRLNEIFDREEKPALVHGDLWSGNFMCDKSSEPVLIDPAVYFGHPAVDLAMTTLFGRLPERFYETYHHFHGLPSNYEEQWEVCNLYPLLVHLYLFGTSYLAAIEQTLKRYS